jgi:hypothetical protein
MKTEREIIRMGPQLVFAKVLRGGNLHLACENTYGLIRELCGHLEMAKTV